MSWFQSQSSGYLTLKLMKFPGSCRSLYLSKHQPCVSRTYSQLQPTNLTYSSSLISRQVVKSLTVQAPHSCLQDSLTTSACRDILHAHLQTSCRSLQSPNTSLCLQDLLPTSACRDALKQTQNHVIRHSIDKSLSKKMTSQPTCQNKNSLFQLEYSSSSMTFDFTMTAYQPSEQQRTLVQAQHVSLRRRSRSSIQTIPASP